MKKIGIMTWYFGANYGAIAQSLALYQTIKSFGYECKMINYRPHNAWKTILATNIPKKGKRLIHLNQTIQGIHKYRLLTNIPYFEETGKVKNAAEIDALGLDAIVFGSDAIFNTKHILCTPLYYGAGIHTRKITYSPSCEYLDPNTKLTEDECQSLTQMKAISVRDTNTFELVKNNIGIEPEITLDPTFLYDFNNIVSSNPTGKYLLIYSFSKWDEYRDQVTEYAKKHALKIVSVGMKREWADESYPSADFETWVQSFRNAEVVLTDSFHGTVFSLKNNKQIVLCGRSDKMAKINSLLKQMGCDLSIYNGEAISEYLNHNVVEYSKVNVLMTSQIRDSMNYLKNALIW